jgi:epoxyqueuosine reductase
LSQEELTYLVKQAALEAGFTKAGITSAEPFERAADHLDEWVKGGMHGLMHYMERSHDKRRDPKLVLASAKSILSLALNYYDPTPPTQAAMKISRYAWGDDYHEVIWEKLEKLLARIKEIAPDAEGRYYCDTGPVMEKAVAERAGVGWIGKHTNVITREIGSWVFLSEIILNLDLIPDPPAEDMCGTCTKCIEACPTDALNEPYKLDATKCISYLTIELKPEHEIPSELAKNMEGWLYGCDICQDVCPWNSFSEPTPLQVFAPREENLALAKEDVEKLTQEEFSNRFRRSPVKRTKLAGLKRNVRALK